MRDFSGQRSGRGVRDAGGAGVSVGVGVDIEGSTAHGDGEAELPGSNRPAPLVDKERMARLVRTIEGEIVPRLVLTRQVVVTPSSVKERFVKGPDAADVKELVRLLLSHDADVAAGYVEAVRHRGASLELVCLELLAPAARELGLLWEQDECNFMEVTVGLCRLHQVLRDISVEFRPEEEASEAKASRTILLAPVPGEQHTFGIMLVAQFLRRAGWDVWHEFPENLSDILTVVRDNWFGVVGLSVGSDTRVDDVAAIIRSIRCGSRNRAVGILVGGPLLVAHPEVASMVGADATAIDGRQAVMRAEHICNQLGAIN